MTNNRLRFNTNYVYDFEYRKINVQTKCMYMEIPMVLYSSFQKKKNHQELNNEDPLMHPIFFWSGISDRFENKNYVKTKSGILKKEF